jgi:D-glycero-D-manno-heptose 1,7-bisphosphate phosphatase
VSTTDAVFLDRDGVLNELVADPSTGRFESPLHPQDVQLVGGVSKSLTTLQSAGYRLACVTNQPAAAKGMLSVDQLLAVQARVTALLAEVGVYIDVVRMCLHHPEGVIEGLSGPCPCRKPEPGMLLSAAAEMGTGFSGSWMVGDTGADVAAGQVAGCRTILVETPGSIHKRVGTITADATAINLSGAVGIIVGRSESD